MVASTSHNTNQHHPSSSLPARHRLRRLQDRSYNRHDLDVFNVLDHPIWIFDCTRKAMYWANESALTLWNAATLDELLGRNYADDMSEATERRLAEYMSKFRNYETASDQWTYYPQDKGATTVNVTLAGIQIREDEEEEGTSSSRLMMFNEGVIPVRDQVDQKNLEGVEMLRHLPVAVCQFDLQGNLMYQNPEAMDLFVCHRSEEGEEKEEEKDNDVDDTASFLSVDSTQSSPPTQANKKEAPSSELDLCSFRSRFVDPVAGQRAFEEVLRDKYCMIEAQQKTRRDGLRWFSISLRLARNPVSSQQVVLYSARDTTEVMRAKEEADRANNEKSEFLAVMAHELRTPLHQVIGLIEVLSQTPGLTEDQVEYVQLMESASNCLMAVINDLLDYSKLEFNKLKLERIPMDVKGVLEGCRQVILPKASDKGLSLSCHWKPSAAVAAAPAAPATGTCDSGCKVLGDPNRLRQILLNLLQNSVKFTHSGSISLSATLVASETETTTTAVPDSNNAESGTRIRFEVTDTGIGISQEDQQQIFGKYRQANVAIARRYGGTGLGLSICKSLVEIMGGKIELQSELGRGTTIAFEIQFDAVADPSLQLSSTKDLEQANENQQQNSLRVLVAEDNKLNQKVIKAMLQRMGHTVVVVADGALAVKAIEETGNHPTGGHNNDDPSPTSSPFDVVLMDQQMPHLDGIEATKLLRAKGYTVPIIGLTASFQPAELQFYKDSGMNDCMGKPVKLHTLRKILQDVRQSQKGENYFSPNGGDNDVRGDEHREVVANQ